MIIKNIPEIPGVEVPEPNQRVLKVLACPELENPGNITILMADIEVKSSTGVHTHDSDEYIYVAEGSGEGVVVTESGEEIVKKIKRETIVIAPRGEKHDIRNTGPANLKLYCVFYPALVASGKIEESIKIQNDNTG